MINNFSHKLTLIMESSQSNNQPVIQQLESSIEELIQHFMNLKTEHDTLQKKYRTLCHEQTTLQKQHQAVKQKIHAMITRLQTLE